MAENEVYSFPLEFIVKQLTHFILGQWAQQIAGLFYSPRRFPVTFHSLSELFQVENNVALANFVEVFLFNYNYVDPITASRGYKHLALLGSFLS